MAEALLRQLDPVRFEAFSAGAFPVGFIHPLAIAAMEELQVPMTEQRSKSWDEFQDQPVDLVITVCSAAAQETCPVWPGAPLTINWPISDPVSFAGVESERLKFAVQTAGHLRVMIQRLITLDFENLPRDDLVKHLEAIGRE